MLTVCPQCHRHIHDHESSCPFCRASSTRNLRVLAAVAIGLAAASCSSNTTSSSDATPTTTSDTADASADGTDSAATDSTLTMAPAYMPAPQDSGASDSDAMYSTEVVALYAAVPDPDR